jgi:hypothetical protein
MIQALYLATHLVDLIQKFQRHRQAGQVYHQITLQP